MCYVCRQPIAPNYQHFCQVLTSHFASSVSCLTVYLVVMLLVACQGLCQSLLGLSGDLFVYQLLDFCRLVKEWVWTGCLPSQFCMKFAVDCVHLLNLKLKVLVWVWLQHSKPSPKKPCTVCKKCSLWEEVRLGTSLVDVLQSVECSFLIIFQS